MGEFELPPWDKELRHCNVKPGDLVLMKSGHYAIVTKIRRSKFSELPKDFGAVSLQYHDIPPHVEVFYCDDTTPGSCSVHRVEKIISASS